MDGIPEELVFDQDRLLAVCENFGDIIFTHEFERFKQALKRPVVGTVDRLLPDNWRTAWRLRRLATYQAKLTGYVVV